MVLIIPTALGGTLPLPRGHLVNAVVTALQVLVTAGFVGWLMPRPVLRGGLCRSKMAFPPVVVCPALVGTAGEPDLLLQAAV